MNPKHPTSKNIVYLITLLAVLFCGVVAGAVSASLIDEAASQELISLISAAMPSVSPYKTALTTLKLPLIIFLLGFTPLGTVFIPVFTGIKGYTLSYTIGAILKAYGVSGIWLSLSIFGFQALILFPVLILLSTQNLSVSITQAKGLFKSNHIFTNGIFTKKHFLISGICFGALFILIVLEICITPQLITHAFNGL